MEEFGSGKGPHERIYPHRHDEQDDGYCASVELLVRKYPCGRIAEQDAYGCILYGDLKRKGECAYRIGVMEEFGEIAEREVAGSVLERIKNDQDERQGDKEHQEYSVGQGPCASLSHFT